MSGVGVRNWNYYFHKDEALDLGLHFVVLGYAFSFLTSWMQSKFLEQLPADWRTLVCSIVSSVCLLPVWWVTYKIIISFIFSVSFVGSFLLFGLSPESDKRERANQPRWKTKKNKKDTKKRKIHTQTARKSSLFLLFLFFFLFFFFFFLLFFLQMHP